MATVNRNVIKLMLIRTELGGNPNLAYKIINAGGKSGWSFGQAQWDLAQQWMATEAKGEPTNGWKTFIELMEAGISDETVRNDIIEKVKNPSSTLTAVEIKSINDALSSEDGKKAIDAAFETHIDDKLSRVDSMVAELRASGREQVADYIANNSLIQMMLIDYDNQFGIDGIDSIGNFTDENDGKLLEYLKNGETTINTGTVVNMDGDFDISDYLDYLFNTQQGFNNTKDVLRRLSEIIKTASENLIGEDGLIGALSLLVADAYRILGLIDDLFLRNMAINGSLDRYFTRGQQWVASRDPLTLDLDGDGIETVGINTNNPILFDHDADGVKTATGWIKGDDGLLVLDRNGNGTIDNGKELFGDSTIMSNGQTAADGFAALADLDSNADGQINANDAQFGSLKVWRDLNQDGISQANELSTLEQQNIASISLTTTQNNQLQPDGNRIMDLGTYTKTDGTTGTTGATGQTGDVDFAENTFYTDFTDSPPITPEAELLPNMEGSGLVRDLREAASIRGDLASVLSAYSSATTRAEQIIKGQKAKGELSAVSF